MFEKHKYKTKISIQTVLENREAEFFDNLLTQNEMLNKTPKELVEFIFKLGLQFASSCIQGFMMSQTKGFMITPDALEDLLNNIYKTPSTSIRIDKVYLDGEETKFYTSVDREVVFKVGLEGEQHRIKLKYKDKVLQLVKHVTEDSF